MIFETISKAEFGRRIGVSRARVTQLVGEGLPVRKNGKIDFAKAAQWVARHLDHYRREGRKPGCHSACNIGSDATLVQLRLFCAD